MNVKSAVREVCSLLADIGIRSVIPEVLRRAKQDRAEAVRCWWPAVAGSVVH